TRQTQKAGSVLSGRRLLPWSGDSGTSLSRSSFERNHPATPRRHDPRESNNRTFLEHGIRALRSLPATSASGRFHPAPPGGRALPLFRLPYGGGEMEKESLAAVRTPLIAHPLYAEPPTADRLRAFMKHHVFAVWDFFTLLKRLQAEVTTNTLPWRPAGHA